MIAYSSNCLISPGWLALIAEGDSIINATLLYFLHKSLPYWCCKIYTTLMSEQLLLSLANVCMEWVTGTIFLLTSLTKMPVNLSCSIISERAKEKWRGDNTVTSGHSSISLHSIWKATALCISGRKAIEQFWTKAPHIDGCIIMQFILTYWSSATTRGISNGMHPLSVCI